MWKHMFCVGYWLNRDQSINGSWLTTSITQSAVYTSIISQYTLQSAEVLDLVWTIHHNFTKGDACLVIHFLIVLRFDFVITTTIFV